LGWNIILSWVCDVTIGLELIFKVWFGNKRDDVKNQPTAHGNNKKTKKQINKQVKINLDGRE